MLWSSVFTLDIVGFLYVCVYEMYSSCYKSLCHFLCYIYVKSDVGTKVNCHKLVMSVY